MTGSIQKKGKAYYIVVSLYDGKTRKQKQRWIPAGKVKKLAEKKLVDMMSEVNNGTYREIEMVTFREYSQLWLKTYAETRLKPSTLRSYRDSVRLHLLPVLGDFFLTEINTGMLQRYVAKRLKIVKAKTVINELVPLKLMFKHAVRWGYLKASPAEYVERPRVEREEMEVLRPDEIRLFLDQVTPKYRAFFLTAVLTGMRRGELLGLQWGDIRLESRSDSCQTFNLER